MPRAKLTAEEKKLRRNLRNDLDKLCEKYQQAGMPAADFRKVIGNQLGLHPSLDLFSGRENDAA
jgi:hypothetical protein